MLIMTRGAAASGKDTVARELRAASPNNTIIVNRDDLRMALYRTEFGEPIDEEFITKIQHHAIRQGLTKGYDVISSDTNLSPKFANQLAYLAYEMGHKVILLDGFRDVPLATCLERNAARKRVVDPMVVEKQWKQSQKAYSLPTPPPEFSLYSGTPGKPRTVLCDLDGTAALHTSGRSPYDESRVLEDTPNQSVRHTLLGLQAQGFTILYVSARTEMARADTLKWLDTHHFPVGNLIMRQTGDQRKDWIVKNEIFDNQIAPNHNVVFALDDRNQVCDAYRRRGIVVHQVNYGDF